jgi:hypothetical protein
MSQAVSLADGVAPTYSAVITGLVGVAGDIVTLTGVAGKVVKLTRVAFSGVATAASATDLTLVKRSTADTGGTGAGMTAVPHDPENAAATAVVTSYTAAPTPGTAVGTIRGVKAQIGLATDANPPNPVVWEFGNGPKMCPRLRTAAQQLCLNIGATNAGALYDVEIEWTEDTAA